MAMGGTFDHFHVGHESFILYAANLSQKLLIGIMNDKNIGQKEHLGQVEPFKIRLKHVLNFCKQNQIDCQLIELNDPYGPTIDKDFTAIDSLCATKETEKGADKINEIRVAMGLRPLPIFLAPLLNDQTNTPLHSTKIRAGKINRDGLIFIKEFEDGLTINQKQRQFFIKPLGPIMTSPDHKQNELAVVVGDYALSQFLLNSWPYQVGVYDKKTKRAPFVDQQLSKIKPDIVFDNPAGTISAATFKEIFKLDLKKTHHILVEGEEDLVTVAFILTLPLGSIIYYGQPDQGMVKLTISEELKDKVLKVLKS